MTKIISCVQLKGGTGKSTITANLAGYLGMKGKSVLIIDADGPKQHTTFAWATFLKESTLKEAEKITAVKVANTEELLSALKEGDGDFDFILIDAPPRMAEMMRAIIFVSDLSLVPFNVTGPDIWALDDMKELIQEAQLAKPDTNFKLVINRLKDKASAWKTRDAVLSAFELPHIKTSLYEYDTYQTVIGKGLHVSAYHVPKPKTQFIQFAKEVLAELK